MIKKIIVSFLFFTSVFASDFSLGPINFTISEEEITFNSEDKIIREFSLTSPRRLVFDFEGKMPIKKAFVKRFNTGPVSRVAFAKHKNYYRVAFNIRESVGAHSSELEGQKLTISFSSTKTPQSFKEIASIEDFLEKNRGHIQDLELFDQNPLNYIDEDEDAALYSMELLQKKANKFKKLYFQPVLEPDFKNTKNFYWGFKFLGVGFYKDKTTLHSRKTINAIKANANKRYFPNFDAIAVAVRSTDVRHMPSALAFYRDPKVAGEGFPFDYMQVSHLKVGEPVHILHLSNDKKWVYAENAHASGWIKRGDLLTVDKEEQKLLKNSEYAVVIRDDVFKNIDNEGTVFTLGSLLAIKEIKKDKIVVYAPSKAQKKLIEIAFDKDEVSTFPMKPYVKNLAKVMNELHGKPYGWGGMEGYRDCSLTTKDLFSIFGIWLSKHSKYQRFGNDYISLKKLDDEDKKGQILKYGKPFQTLLVFPTHVALYIGEKDGEPIAFHTVWGVRTYPEGKKEERVVVGQTIISSLELGKEIDGYVPAKSSYLKKIVGMTRL